MTTEPPRNGTDPEDIHGVPDATLAGYLDYHQRPPAFDGSDGRPYSVSVEVEKVASLTAPYVGYLVFPRWADTGLGVVGHVQTPVLMEGRSREDVERALGGLSLHRVKELLDAAIHRRAHDDPDADGEPQRNGGGVDAGRRPGT